MRNYEKDVLMICKGHYNHGKYKTVKESLDAFCRKIYRISYEVVPELSYSLIFKLILNKCVETFANQNNINSFIHNILCQKIIPENKTTDFYEVLFFKIVEWLSSLKVVDSNDNWIIDLSDYSNDEFIV